MIANDIETDANIIENPMDIVRFDERIPLLGHTIETTSSSLSATFRSPQVSFLLVLS